MHPSPCTFFRALFHRDASKPLRPRGNELGPDAPPQKSSKSSSPSSSSLLRGAKAQAQARTPLLSHCLSSEAPSPPHMPAPRSTHMTTCGGLAAPPALPWDPCDVSATQHNHGAHHLACTVCVSYLHDGAAVCGRRLEHYGCPAAATQPKGTPCEAWAPSWPPRRRACRRPSCRAPRRPPRRRCCPRRSHSRFPRPPPHRPSPRPPRPPRRSTCLRREHTRATAPMQR